MAQLQQYLNALNGWEQVAAAQQDNAEQLPSMESYRAKLLELLERARSLTNDHHTLTASKQEVSRNLQETLRQGQKLVDLMRTAAVEHYGADSDKLVEFGVKPFRGRNRKPKAPDSPSPTPPPETTE